MELSMASSGIEGPPVQESRRIDTKRGGKPPFKGKEAMATSVTKIKVSRATKDKEKVNYTPTNNAPPKDEQRRSTLKELMAKQYPFLDSDLPGIFDDLLKNNLIELPEMKRPEEEGRSDDPKYCKYHRLVSHPIQDCFVFKEKVMKLAREGKISLDEENANVNTISSGKNHEENDQPSLEEPPNKTCVSTEVAKPIDCMTTISFSDEDLLLGSKPHNRPLFVSGFTREHKVKRILIDGGSTVNILPLHTMREVGIPVEDLASSRLMIQGFN